MCVGGGGCAIGRPCVRRGGKGGRLPGEEVPQLTIEPTTIQLPPFPSATPLLLLPQLKYILGYSVNTNEPQLHKLLDQYIIKARNFK